MPFNINEFRSHISEAGYLKKNHFQLTFGIPTIFQGAFVERPRGGNSVENINRMMTFRVANVRTPQIAISTLNALRYGVGPVQKYPYSAQFNETIFTVTCDRLGDIWQFWHNWIKQVFDFTGTVEANSGNVSRLPTYDSNFRDDYSTLMQLEIFDQVAQNDKTGVLRFDMFEAYPVAMTEIPLSWGDGGLIELVISVHFKEYTIVGSNVRSIGFPDDDF